MCRSQAFSFYWRLLLENWKMCEKEYLVRLRIPAWSLNAVGVSSKAIGCGTAVTIFVNPLWTPRSGSISTLYLFKNKILNTLRHQIIATIAKIVRIRRRNKVRLRGNFQKNKVRIRTKIVRIQKKWNWAYFDFDFVRSFVANTCWCLLRYVSASFKSFSATVGSFSFL